MPGSHQIIDGPMNNSCQALPWGLSCSDRKSKLATHKFVWTEQERHFQESRLKELGYSTYQAYITSRRWVSTRGRMMVLLPHVCVGCEETDPEELCLHHRTYERLGEERPDDLLWVC